MTIDKIGYHKNYNIIGMQWEKIIMEGTLEPGDDEMECIKTLRAKCDQSAQVMAQNYYPEHYNVVAPTQSITVGHYSQDGITPISNHEPEEKLTQEEKINNLISQSTSLPELEQWKLLSNNTKYPSLKQAYEEKLLELSK